MCMVKVDISGIDAKVLYTCCQFFPVLCLNNIEIFSSNKGVATSFKSHEICRISTSFVLLHISFILCKHSVLSIG